MSVRGDVVVEVSPLLQWVWCGPYSDYWAEAGCPRACVLRLPQVSTASMRLTLATETGGGLPRAAHEEIHEMDLIAATTDHDAAAVFLAAMARLMVRMWVTPRHYALVRPASVR